jgi:hypothetical protein
MMVLREKSSPRDGFTPALGAMRKTVGLSHVLPLGGK